MTCLNKEHFKYSPLREELRFATEVLGYETISDMLFSEYQKYGKVHAMSVKLGFSEVSLRKYLKFLGVEFKKNGKRIILSAATAEDIVAYYKLGYSIRKLSFMYKFSQGFIAGLLKEHLSIAEYERLTAPRRY